MKIYSRPRSPLLRYGVALVVSIGACFIALISWSITHNNPYLVFIGAIAISAWYGGLGAGILSTALSVIFVDYFLLSRRSDAPFSVNDILTLVVFLLLALLISIMEETRTQSNLRSKVALTQLEAVLDGIADGVTAQDTTGQPVFANESAVMLLGYTSVKELLDTPIQEARGVFICYDEHDVIVPTTQLPSTIAFSEGIPSEKLVKIKFQRTLQERWILLKATPVKDERNKVILAINIIRDVTDERMRLALETERLEIAEALREASSLLTGTLDLNEVLNRVIYHAERVIDHDAANLMVVENNRVRVSRIKGYAVDGVDYWSMPIVDALPLRQMARTFKPIVQNNIQTDEYWRDLPERVSGFQSYIGAVISLQGRIIGFLNIFSKDKSAFNELKAITLQLFANQASIAIQNATVYQQSVEIAALEERQRVARELHDSVSQTLFTSNVMAESALRQWDRDRDKSHHLMEQVHQLTGRALAEMRVLLLELRPKTLESAAFSDMVHLFVESIISRRKINIQLNIDVLPDLATDIKLALYRIVQESLNNIVKHADASNVTVDVLLVDQQIHIAIEDDGLGFSLDTVGGTSLGLDIMRERAEAIQATFAIRSDLQQGTHIDVTWTLPPNQESE